MVLGVRGVPRLTAPLVQGPLDTLPPYVRAEGQRRIHRYRGWGHLPPALPRGRVHPVSILCRAEMEQDQENQESSKS